VQSIDIRDAPPSVLRNHLLREEAQTYRNAHITHLASEALRRILQGAQGYANNPVARALFTEKSSSSVYMDYASPDPQISPRSTQNSPTAWDNESDDDDDDEEVVVISAKMYNLKVKVTPNYAFGDETVGTLAVLKYMRKTLEQFYPVGIPLSQRYVCIYECLYICMYAYANMYMHVCAYARIYECTYV
jgi:hypothetical protein